MFRLKAFVFSAVLCSLVVLGQGDASTEKPVTITVPKPTTTTPAPETTSSTTLSSTTSSTEAPTTPSSTSTTSTTEVPPTEPPKPTPPPAPTPLPAPTQGTWHYDEKNVTCIVVQFAARLNVTYTMKNCEYCFIVVLS
ncbi:classical arabinogalactan protein 10-like [Hyposmocoma kahamanoa]|uniref:classical arabinogalactan protein 10-like n=1 Tax=Hyposmocoma kahamanoa TaxID=1477025 RepID=UPI000E6D7E02|nr:classical arabinogalactan protein 10-like [Hyposmocoma kahamanoa]